MIITVAEVPISLKHAAAMKSMPETEYIAHQVFKRILRPALEHQIFYEGMAVGSASLRMRPE